MKVQFFALVSVSSIFAIFLMGCKKDSAIHQTLASLQVVNTIIGGGNVKVNTNKRDSVLIHNAKSFGLAIVNDEAHIQIWSSIIHDKPFYNNKIQAQTGDTYSLFLYGWPGNLESLLIKEQVPAWYTDSVIGVRVAHCAPGTGPVNITLKINPAVSIFRGVAYKTMSNVTKISLPNLIPAGAVSFEIRDAVDNKLLTTYVLPANANFLYPGISVTLQRFKNITLVIKGSRDTLSGPNSFGVFPVAMSY